MRGIDKKIFLGALISLFLFVPVFFFVKTTQASTYTQNLSLGASGSEVFSLQNILRDAGYFEGVSTGYFGEKTREALLAFQIAHGLSATAMLDSETRAFLNGTGYGVSEADEVARVVDLLLALGIIPAEKGARVRLLVDEYRRTLGGNISSLKIDLPDTINATKKKKSLPTFSPDSISLPQNSIGSTTLPSFNYGSSAFPRI